MFHRLLFTTSTLVSLWLAANVTRADLIIEFDNARMQAGEAGAIDVFVRSSDGVAQVAQYNLLFAVTHVTGPGIMEFQETRLQDNSETRAANYIFAGDSNDFQATRGDSLRNQMTQSDFASANVPIPAGVANRRLIGRLEINHIVPSDQLATFPGAEYHVSLVRSNEQTFFNLDDFDTRVAINDISYSNFGTLSVVAVPEPAAGLLMIASFAMATFVRRRSCC